MEHHREAPAPRDEMSDAPELPEPEDLGEDTEELPALSAAPVLVDGARVLGAARTADCLAAASIAADYSTLRP